MVGLLMGKLFGCVMVANASAWLNNIARDLMGTLAFGNVIIPLITLSLFEY